MEGIYLHVFVKDIPLYDTPYIKGSGVVDKCTYTLTLASTLSAHNVKCL